MRVFILLIGCLILAAFGWLVWASYDIEMVRSWEPILGLFLSVITLAAGFFVAYVEWLSPHSISVMARPYIWRLGPVKPDAKSIELTFWLTVSNNGARPGAIEEFFVMVSMPKAKWVLQPVAFVKQDEYFLLQFGKQFDLPPTLGPFTPIYLAGRSQITKTIMFVPMTGKDEDFNPLLVEAGVHEVSIYAKLQDEEAPRLVAKQKLIIEKDVLDMWRSGQTVGGMVAHHESDYRKKLPK